MKRFGYLAIVLMALAWVACSGGKNGGDSETEKEKFVLSGNWECNKLAQYDEVKWFTITFKRVGEPDSTVLFASYDDKTLPTNVVRIGDGEWRNFTFSSSHENLDSIQLTPIMFTPEARITAVKTETREMMEEEAKKTYEDEVKQMENAAFCMLRDLSLGKDSFANYCTPELGALGKKFHSYYVNKDISYPDQYSLPCCGYIGCDETEYGNVKLAGSNPAKATVNLKAEGFGEGGDWWKIDFTCLMTKIDGKWVVSKITEKDGPYYDENGQLLCY